MKWPRHHHLALPILGFVIAAALIGAADAADANNDVADHRDEQQRKHKHHLLLFMGGLKSLAAVVLIKIKIVLVVAAIVAVVVFTIKYLLGATGLPDLGGLLYKANNVVVPPPPPQHPPVPPYLMPVVHEPVYGHDYHTSIPWEQSGHETYGNNNWSKLGNGGRSLLEIATFYPVLGDVLLQNYFNHRKRVKRKRHYYYQADMSISNGKHKSRVES